MLSSFFSPKLSAVLASTLLTFSLGLPVMAGTTKSLPEYRQQDVGARATTVQDQAKIQKLARYVQDGYNLTTQNAVTIVSEAMRSGARHGLEPELILAVIAVESTFKGKAVSPRGARGLMQVKADAHRHKVKAIGGTQALFDTSSNIHTGSQILAEYIDHADSNVRRALLYYCGSIKNPKSSYPDKVLRIYQDLKQL